MVDAREPARAFEFRGFRLDPVKRRLYGPDGQPVPVGPRAFDTLCLLVRRAGEPVSKAEIRASVWAGAVIEDNNLNQAISALRQALGDDRRNPAFIATITGRGYQFIADVTPATPADEPAVPADDPPEDAGQPTGLRRTTGLRWVRRGTQTAVVAGALLLAGWGLLLLLLLRAPSPPVRLGAPTLVTDFPGSHTSPTLSADGTWMAFVSDASGIEQIWIKTLPDGLPMQITSGQRPATAPSWSPVDGSLLFQRALEDGTPAVWRVDALGASRPRLVVANARYPRLSPDGRALTFTRRVGNQETIGIAAVDGADETMLDVIPQSAGFAAPMPAMNSAGDIAFVHADEGPSGNLWWYHAADGSFEQLTRPRSSALSGTWARAPAWLPDGRSILFAASEVDPSDMHLWYADTTRGRAIPLTQGVGGYDAPAVSADGSRVVYAHARPVWQLVATDPRSGNERVIHESRRAIALPLISPDGADVLFFGEHVYSVPFRGGAPRQLTSGEPGTATLPTWDREGGGVVYYYRERQLHRLDVDTGASEMVLDNFHWSSKNWLTAHGDRMAWVQRGFELGRGRTMVHLLPSGVTRELDEALWPTEWSRDGARLLGRRMKDSAVVICEAPQFRCEPVLDDAGAIVTGARPRWSADERRVFFRHAQPDRPGYAWILAVSTDGGAPQRMAEIGPYEPENVFFSVGSDDVIVWNRHLDRGTSEIWMAELERRE